MHDFASPDIREKARIREKETIGAVRQRQAASNGQRFAVCRSAGTAPVSPRMDCGIRGSHWPGFLIPSAS